MDVFTAQQLFLRSLGFFGLFISVVTASHLAHSQVWFKATKNTRLINSTSREVIFNVTSSYQCMKLCKQRRRNGVLACSYANYEYQQGICELCDATGNITVENGWDCWIPEPKRDCTEVYKNGGRTSGSYDVYLPDVKNPVTLYCDMDTDGGGWTVFQRRIDGSVDFFLDWQHYKEGFGDVNGEFWLGNDNLHYITNSDTYELRVDLIDDSDIKVFAKYSNFLVNNEIDNYRLNITGYDNSSTAGDSMTTSSHSMNQMQFTTYDKDHDFHPTDSCANLYKGGWWYRSCHTSNLNGLYLKGDHATYADGIEWNTFRGIYHSLLFSEMKIRPKGFVNN